MEAPSVGPASVVARRGAEREALLGVLAHELRTPITTIYAGSALLAFDEELLPSMRRELAADVHAEAARLFRAVEDLLVLTRIEHGALERSLTHEPVSLSRAVDAAAQLESSRWPGLHVAVRDGGVTPLANADPNALAHALRNLVGNVGWRATGPTGLEIVVWGGDGRVACRLLDRTETLTTADLGGLFALPSGDPRPGLTSPGLGMFAAAQLIEAMGGAVWASSQDGTVEIGFSLPGYELSA